MFFLLLFFLLILLSETDTSCFTCTLCEAGNVIMKGLNRKQDVEDPEVTPLAECGAVRVRRRAEISECRAVRRRSLLGDHRKQFVG